MIERILKSKLIEMANKYEHSAEVMVPLLKYFLDYDIKLAPIVIKNQTLKNSMQVAASIRRAAKALGRRVILIASSDFSHYVEPLYGARVDSEAVEKIFEIKGRDKTNKSEQLKKAKQRTYCFMMTIQELMSIGLNII